MEMDAPLVGEIQQLKELLGRVVEMAKLVDRDDARAVCKEADSYLSNHNSIPSANGSVGELNGEEEEDDISDGGSEMEEKEHPHQQQPTQAQLMMQQPSHQHQHQHQQNQMHPHQLHHPQHSMANHPPQQPMFPNRPQHLDVFNPMSSVRGAGNAFNNQVVPRGLPDDISFGMTVGSILSPRMVDLNADDFFPAGKCDSHKRGQMMLCVGCY